MLPWRAGAAPSHVRVAKALHSTQSCIGRPLHPPRLDERTFKVVAIAPEAQVDRSGFNSAVGRAKARAKRDYAVAL